MRILLADDHAIIRHGLRALLDRPPEWMICGEAANGEDALTVALREKPDVVIIDVAMPEMNGLETTRAIRRALPNTEVLVFASSESDAMLIEALQAGARGFVLKTDPARFVTTAISALAEHKQFFTPKLSLTLVDRHPGAKVGRADQPLSPRQRAILKLIAEGGTNREMAAGLGISVKTVETHRSAIMRKVGMGSIAQLVRYAVRNQIIEA